MRPASILSDDRRCFICKRTSPLHVHHVFHGSGRRDISDREGCWCYLCPECHNMSSRSVHMNRDMDEWLMRKCQERWEERRMSEGHDAAEARRMFILRFYESYIEDDLIV